MRKKQLSAQESGRENILKVVMPFILEPLLDKIIVELLWRVLVYMCEYILGMYGKTMTAIIIWVEVEHSTCGWKRGFLSEEVFFYRRHGKVSHHTSAEEKLVFIDKLVRESLWNDIL